MVVWKGLKMSIYTFLIFRVYNCERVNCYYKRVFFQAFQLSICTLDCSSIIIHTPLAGQTVVSQRLLLVASAQPDVVWPSIPAVPVNNTKRKNLGGHF